MKLTMNPSPSTGQNTPISLKKTLFFKSECKLIFITIMHISSEKQSKDTSKMKKENFWRQLKKYIREYFRSTSIHGIRYINENRSTTEKVFWIVFILLSLTGCLYMISEIITKYEESPVVVSFSTKDTPIYEIPFPAVTICPESKCARAKYNYTDIYLKYLVENLTVNDNDLRIFHYMSLVCADDDNEKVTSTGNKTVGEDFYKIMNELKPESNLVCNFMGKEYLYQNCEEILTPIITDEGICYSFNILDRRKIYRDHIVHYEDFHQVKNDSDDFDGESGFIEGAGVKTYPTRALMSGADNAFDIVFVDSRGDNDFACNKYLQGFRISLHNPMDIPRLSKHYFRVPLDKAVVVAVQPELIVTSHAVKQFKPNKRECYLQNERPLRHFKVYTQANCMLECVTNHTLNKCGCVSFYMPRDKDTPVCGTANSNCMEEASDELKIKELENKISGKLKKGESSCDCKSLCTELKYNIETSHSSFYWREYFALDPDLETLNDGEHHVSILSIYLKSEQFMTLERNQLYGISDLVSNFGGLLGLFTGFSLISLVELIYFLTLRIFCNSRLYGMWSGQPS